MAPAEVHRLEGWCTSCGGPAVITGRGLDPRWMAGYCRPLDPASKPCRAPISITLDADEARGVVAANHQRAVERNHGKHKPERPNPHCRHCQAVRELGRQSMLGTIAAGTSPAAGAARKPGGTTQ